MDTPPPIPDEKPEPFLIFSNEKGIIIGICLALGIPAICLLLFVVSKGIGVIGGGFIAGIKEGSEASFSPPFAYQFFEVGKADFRPYGGELEPYLSLQLINQTQAQTSVFCTLMRDEKVVFKELITVPGNGSARFYGKSENLYSKNPDDWEELIFSGDKILIEKTKFSKITLNVP